MRNLSIVLLIFAAIVMAGHYEQIDFYTGGLTMEGTCLWIWDFVQEPKSVDDVGYTPATAAIEVMWGKAPDGWDENWISYGVYIGDGGFDMQRKKSIHLHSLGSL